jgi:hypothetical protein
VQFGSSHTSTFTPSQNATVTQLVLELGPNSSGVLSTMLSNTTVSVAGTSLS